MSKLTYFIAGFALVVIAGLVVWILLISGELSETKEMLLSTQNELGVTSDKLDTAEDELASAREDIADLSIELQSALVEKATVETDLENSEKELADTKSTLNSVRSDVSRKSAEIASLSDEIEETENKLDIAWETLDGLGISISGSRDCRDAALVDNPEAVNPTWAELKSFLANDDTDRHPYIIDVYDCSQFSRDIHNNAEAAGIRSAVVHVDWTDDTAGHALNAFITTDYGLVYVDATGSPDTVARIEQDESYRALDSREIVIGNIREDWYWNSLWHYYYIPSDSGGEAEVRSIIIYW